MNTTIVKKVLIALAVLVMATMMTACDLSAPVDTGSSVEVVMGGIDGAAGAKAIGGDATWVSIRVVNSSGVQKGTGDLTKDGAGVWRGMISVSETGLMTFTAIAGSTASQVAWIGKNTLNVTGNGLLLTVVVSAPTSDGSGYGPAGGKVFYDKGTYSSGWRYLEAAPSDQGSTYKYSNITGTAVGVSAQGTTIGTGQANTTAIVGQAGCTSGAAKTCDDLVLGGYSDWFLPSKDELNAMYGKKAAIGGFLSFVYYWSSSEGFDSNVWVQYFSDGSQSYGNKGGNFRVRAVRAF